MKKYKPIPNWWFHVTLLVSFVLALILCTVMKDQVQMPWWGLIFAAGLALTFTLPISIITATTNQVYIQEIATIINLHIYCFYYILYPLIFRVQD